MALKLENLHPALKWFLVFLPLIIIVTMFYFFIFSPKHQEIKRLEAEISKQESEIARKEAKITKLPILKAEYAKKKKEYEELKFQLPEEKEISNLLKQVSDLGIESGLKVLLWQPQKRSTHSSGIVYEIPVKVNMTGAYHRLGRFFSKLTTLERVVNLRNIDLGKPKPQMTEAMLNITFNAVTFSAIPEDEIQKTQKSSRK